MSLFCLGGRSAFAQDKTLAYYNCHETELFPDAQGEFYGGNYARVIELCDWYFVLFGDKKANSLREKASKCALLLREISDLAASGRIDEAEQKVESLRSINPKAIVDISKYTSKLKPDRIEMVKKYIYLPVFDTEAIQIQSFPKGTVSRESINWNSSNPEIVSVDSYGTVSARQTGEAKITAIYGELSAVCVVTVDNLKMSSNSICLCVGDKSMLSLSMPVDNVVWSVENPDIVSLREINDGVELCAKHAGKTVVTALRGRNKLACKIEIEDVLIDLGLPSGTLWASHNLGADFKTNVGDSFSADDVFLSDSNVAEVKLGKNWTIPTLKDYQELINNCEKSYITLNDQTGVQFKSKINGKSLFFPTQKYNYACYWADSMDSAFSLYMNDFCGLDYSKNGSLIRAVYYENDSDIRVLDVQLEAEVEGTYGYPDALGIAANDIQYLFPNLRVFCNNSQTAEFDVRIIEPDGSIKSGDESRDGYSYSCERNIEKGYSNVRLLGWGNQEGGTYVPGRYEIQIWNKGKCLYSSSFILREQSMPTGKGAIPIQLVDVKPAFNTIEGTGEFIKWVNQRLVYPDIAKENGLQGKVSLQFIITAEGKMTKVRVLRGVDPSLDQEALRVVSSSPTWTPGKINGVAVDVSCVYHIIFQLR